MKELKGLSKEDSLIPLYAAKEDKYNNAEALKDFLRRNFK